MSKKENEGKCMKSILELKQNYLITGRAATAIYLVLKANHIENKQVLVPANVCYAAIYPVTYSGNSPVFCDVEADTGNVSLETIKNADLSNVKAMIIPHMYGNPVKDMLHIKTFCNENNIILIEDCASAMGVTMKNEDTTYRAGSFGDYVIYSTGYSKTINVGNGGILASDHCLDIERTLYQELPEFTEQSEHNLSFFSKLYRLIRNDQNQNLCAPIYQFLPEYMRDMYLYRIDSVFEDKIIEALKGLDEIIEQRRNDWNQYNQRIDANEHLTKYAMEEGSVPWRFNMYINESIRKEFIAYLLDHHVPVSDWYPNVAPMFQNNQEYANTTKIEHTILNLPLMIEETEIARICDVINHYFNK